ncbi:AMP-binding protein, partial [candidate division KSB1 bacterium]|nr:AMP-binding protein [candidate division KSB1 bacterium]
LSLLLHKQGIHAGDRVAILSENKPNWGLAYFAITTMGAVAVPILPDFNSIEVKHILRHCGAKAIFVSERLYNKIEDEFESSLRTVFLIEDFSIIPLQTKKDRLQDIIAEGSKELAKIKSAALRLAGKSRAEAREQDLAAIIYTSGTTGNSKGVMLTHKNIVYDAVATTQIIQIDETDRLLSILPLSHAYECTLGLVIPIMIGASVYYLDKPPTAKVLLPAMEKVKPTVVLSVPLIIEKIYKTRILPRFTQKRIIRGLYKYEMVRKKLHKKAGKKLLKVFGGALRSFCIGGASLSPEVELFLREAGFPYAIGYGLTETSPLIAGSDPYGTVPRSTGKPLPGIEIMIDTPDPYTGEGEVLARGPVVMNGYYNDPTRTAEVLSKDGWLRTGDLGVFDENGNLYIKGRLKNVIIGPSGENIYPEEIEAIINEHEDVLESLVYEQNDQLVARVYLNYEELDNEFRAQKLDDTQAKQRIVELLEQIRTQVNARVASFSRINRIIEQPEPFVKTPTQKIKRFLYV